GGAGYIGSVTTKLLMEKGFGVLVLDNLSTGFLSSVSCPLIVGDVGDARLLDKIFSEHEIEAVVHFAASSIVEESVFFPGLYFQNNVTAGIALLNSMVRHNVKKLVFSSSAAVYGEPEKIPIAENAALRPTNPYGQSKLIFEQMLPWYWEAHEISSVSLRYFNAAGAAPDISIGDRREQTTHLIPRVLKVALKKTDCLEIYGHDYPTLDGTAIRDYIHVQDLAAAHILALNKLEQHSGYFAYNVGTGRGHSVMEVVERALEITEKMIPIKYGPRRPGDPVALFADVAKIKKELGFDPVYSDLDTIIKSAWDWYCDLWYNKVHATRNT
ncbi:MAG: UDP-glucose 4-epimerase GalE, partial [Candidatus Doudnabacteria bacterium]|nr:UDP-glucose 4-epimerase GalE [Candidatus Doudnabacteria bacterium]